MIAPLSAYNASDMPGANAEIVTVQVGRSVQPLAPAPEANGLFLRTEDRLFCRKFVRSD
jgi:hypothetical protein